MADNGKTFTNKVFTEILEAAGRPLHGQTFFKEPGGEGIVESLNEFFELVNTASESHSEMNNIPEQDRLVFAEEVPHELLAKLNSTNDSTTISQDSVRDIRVVTHTADERPAVISARKTDEYSGIRSVKWRLIDTIEDPDYTGYSIARFGKDIEATIDFKVWGIYYHDIRTRAQQLRDILDQNTWFFKHKGLRDLIWQESIEAKLWDGKNIVKEKTERYLVRYTQVKELRQKNLEQMVVLLGVEEPETN